ncbi:MAG: hypothetical protein AAGI90_02235 [Chlamydiota bacterium]
MSAPTISQKTASSPITYPESPYLFSIFDIKPEFLFSTFKNAVRTCFVVNRWINIYVHSVLLMIISCITVFVYPIIGSLSMLFSCASILVSKIVITRITNRVLSVYEKQKKTLQAVPTNEHPTLGYSHWDPRKIWATYPQEENRKKTAPSTPKPESLPDQNSLKGEEFDIEGDFSEEDPLDSKLGNTLGTVDLQNLDFDKLGISRESVILRQD